MNSWTIAGRIGRDAEVRFTQSGTPVAGFAVAVDVYQGKGQERGTMWVDCSLFGERAEALAPHLTKGTVVSVTGEAGARAYESKQDGSLVGQPTLRALQVTLLGGGKREGEEGGQARGERPARGGQQGRPQQANRGGPKYGEGGGPPPSRGNDPFPDDDIPF